MPSNVSTTLRDELSLIRILIDLMKQEQGLLVAADTDGLNAITPQKNQLIGQLGEQNYLQSAMTEISPDKSATGN